ncbi:MAG TPA: hypothetical protein VK212_02345 [Lentimicrobium sp.]|nr:hypothetical protein [Lentimicrobium sp.]
MNTQKLQILGLRIAGTIFGLVAFMHLLRVITMVSITISGCQVPVWVNIIGFIGSGALCLLFWIVSNKR